MRGLYSAASGWCERKPFVRVVAKWVHRCRSVLLVILFFLLLLQYAVPALIYSKNSNAYATAVGFDELVPRGSGVTDANASVPLLTLFTTFKDIPLRRTINENTLRYWGRLRPEVQPVLYVESSGSGVSDYLSKLARKQGWLVFEAPRFRRGYPLLRDMFQHAIHNVTTTSRGRSKFVGYANSDVLFTRDLLETLSFLAARADPKVVKKRGLLVSGRRINMLVQDLKFEEGGRFIDHSVLGKTDIIYDSEDAIDYFITTPDGYPWRLVPDFVVGKPGYDNWLVQKAVEWDLLSVDTSLTISALHQSMAVKHTDKGWLSKDVCINRDLVDVGGTEFPYAQGSTSCLKYFTQATKVTFYEGKVEAGVGGGEERVMLYRRKALTRTCQPPFSLRETLWRLVAWSSLGRKKGFCAAIASEKTWKTEKYRLMMNKS